MAIQQNKLNGSFISISAKDTTSEKSVITQMADILESDITDNVRRYEVYEKPNASDGSISIKSSLFQTILDQPLENSAVANELFDITMGTYAKYNSDTKNYTVLDKTVSVDNAGKLFVDDGSGGESNDHYNVREKVSIYRQFAQMLLGDADKQFTTKASVDESAVDANPGVNDPKLIDAAIFLCFKRLFVNDNIAKGSFELNIFNETSDIHEEDDTIAETFKNLINVDHQGTADVINDSSSQVFISVSSGGEVGTLYKDSSPVGLVYYDMGVVVLDASRVLNLDQNIKGIIESITTGDTKIADDDLINDDDATAVGHGEIYYLGTLKSFLFRASLDDVIDHIRQRIRKTRTYASVASSVNSAISFSSEMFINSSLIFCRAAPTQCNLSSNPTYTDADGKIHATITSGSSSSTFSYVTTVGLYDASGDLLAVAKTSRPIEKNSETDLSIRVRIDY